VPWRIASMLHSAPGSESFFLTHVLPIGQPTYIDTLTSIGTYPNPGAQPAIETHWTRDPNGTLAPNDDNVHIAHGFQALIGDIGSPAAEPEGAHYPICAWAPDDVGAIRMTYEGGGVPANETNTLIRFWTP